MRIMLNLISVPLDLWTKMKNICSDYSNSLKKLVLHLVSLIIYEVFSLLICLGVVKDKQLSSKFNKFTRHQRLIRYSIKRRSNWEMRRTLVSAPEITPTYDCGALLLGAVIIYYLRKKKLKSQDTSIDNNAINADFKDITRNLILLFAMSMEMYLIYHEASVIEMRENHNVMVFKELLMAGDVELNPGPYPPELLARLMNDFAELKPEYYSLGVQLKVPVYVIEEIKSDTGDRLAKIFDHWLHNTRKDLWFEQLCTALQRMHRSDLAAIVQQKYMIKSTEETPLSIVEVPPTESACHFTDLKDIVASSSPSIKPSDISVDSQEDVCILTFHALDGKDIQHKHELIKETNKMILLFTDITNGLYKFITNQKALKKFKNLIQSWIKYRTIEEDDPYKDVTKKMVRGINDNDELWDIFSSYFSFFNFKVVEQAIDIMNYEAGEAKMKSYKQEFNCYLKRRVTQCPSGIGMKGEDHVILLVELDDAFADCRIEHLLQLGDDICNIMNFKADKLQIEGVNKGCICVAFHLYKSEIPQGFFLLYKQIELLQKLRYMAAKILKLKCNGVCYLINEETSDDTESYLNTQIHYSRVFQYFKKTYNKTITTIKSTNILHQNNIESLHTFKILIKDSNYDPSQRDEDGITALHCAAVEGNMAVVRFLLEECRLHHLSLNKHQHSLLHLAAAHGHLELVHYLMKDKHLHPLSPDSHGWTPVHYAIAAGHLNVVKLFSESEGILESLKRSVIKYKIVCYNILHIAIFTQNMSVLKVLLSRGYGDRSDCLSLLLSVTNSTLLEYLIENIDFNITSKRKATIAAVHCGDLKSTVYLTRQFRNYGADSEGNTLLHVAARNGHLSIVQFIMEDMKIELNIRNQNNRTPLHYASIEGHVDVIKFLIDNPLTDTMAKDKENNTPLHLAALYGQLSVVKYFISDLRINPNIKGNCDRTPLHCACENGHIDVIKFFIDNPLTDRMARDYDNNIPLHLAAYYGQLPVVKYFISDLHLNPNIKGNIDRTPLHCASVKGHIDVIKLLIDNTITEPMARNKNNNTPLHLAALNGQLLIVKYFISDLRINPNINGNCDRTPLHCACENGHIDVIKFLIDNPLTDPMARDKDNNIPLHLAAYYGQLPVVKFFISDLHLNPNIKGNIDRTPLHCASVKGHVDVMKFLIDHRLTDPMARDEYNDTPLHLTARNKQVHVFKFIIEQLGFDPSIKGRYGWRPLHMASASGDLELIRYLVEDLNCSPSIDEESPLVIAERNGNDNVVMYFIEKFPLILDFNQFSEISSGTQDISINNYTTSNEIADQSSSSKPHDHISESISDLLYEVSKSKNEATSNPIITEEKHSTEPTFRQHLHKYTHK